MIWMLVPSDNFYFVCFISGIIGHLNAFAFPHFISQITALWTQLLLLELQQVCWTYFLSVKLEWKHLQSLGLWLALCLCGSLEESLDGGGGTALWTRVRGPNDSVIPVTTSYSYSKFTTASRCSSMNLLGISILFIPDCVSTPPRKRMKHNMWAYP